MPDPNTTTPAPDGDAVERAGRAALDAYEAIPYDNDLTGEQVWALMGRAALAAAREPGCVPIYDPADGEDDQNGCTTHGGPWPCDPYAPFRRRADRIGLRLPDRPREPDVEQVWNEGFEAGADFREYQVGPSGIPQDPPLNPYRRPAAREPVTQDDRGAITVPRPHVAHGPQGVHPDQADADYLRAAVRNIEYQDRGERLWGSGVTAMIVRLLTDAAAALEAPARPSVPTVTAEQVRSIASESGRAEGVVRDWLRTAGIEVQP